VTPIVASTKINGIKVEFCFGRIPERYKNSFRTDMSSMSIDRIVLINRMELPPDRKNDLEFNQFLKTLRRLDNKEMIKSLIKKSITN